MSTARSGPRPRMAPIRPVILESDTTLDVMELTLTSRGRTSQPATERQRPLPISPSEGTTLGRWAYCRKDEGLQNLFAIALTTAFLLLRSPPQAAQHIDKGSVPASQFRHQDHSRDRALRDGRKKRPPHRAMRRL